MGGNGQLFSRKNKIPTLRNLDKRPHADFVKAYMHNGRAADAQTRRSVREVTCWPAPENPETMNRKQLGELKLSDQQEDLLVAFLKTLTDGYSPAAK